MKRKILFGLLIAVLSLGSIPTLTSAQNLTVSDVRQLAPSLATALRQLSQVVAVKQATFNRQNIVLSQMGPTIGSIGQAVTSLDTASLTPAERVIFQNQVNLLADQFNILGTYLNRVSQERATFNTALGTIVSILGSITSAISTVSV